MPEPRLEIGTTIALQKTELDKLLTNVRAAGFETIGPRIQDEALVYEPIDGLSDLPQGYTSEQSTGHYRLLYVGHARCFDITPGPHTWKQFLFPPCLELFELHRDGTWQLETPSAPAPHYAFIGVRACELAAIGIQDRVFLRGDYVDPIYRGRRQSLFILAVNCMYPGGTCFCASMKTGPRATSGFDLSLTELDDLFLIEIGSEIGRGVVSGLSYQLASAFVQQLAQKGLARAASQMGRTLDTSDLPDVLLENLEHPHWAEVAQRCLSCANCTHVCPTCFCWDDQVTGDLLNRTTQRVRVWDSCFNPGYSYQAGGNTRPNVRSRYRQWLTHKLGTWQQQFDTLGCVGCGRCITWCPAGIDITEEIPALREEARK